MACNEFSKIDLENSEEVEKWPGHVLSYGVGLEQAAPDLTNCKARQEVLSEPLK